MPVTLGGSLGITYPDASTTAAAGITARFSPYITNTANVMSLSGVNIDGSVGVYTPLQTATTSSVNANIVISTNTSNYVLDTSKVAGYIAGITNVTVTINSGIVVSSASTGSPAFIVNSSWATGDTISIVNNGSIIGMGGAGGGTSSAGFSAGPAFNTSRAVTFNNTNGTIAGGGGGGGGGGSSYVGCCPPTLLGGGGGGGGRTGSTNSLGGVGSGGGGNGGQGTITSAGGGGAGNSPPYGRPGAAGGNWGSAGGNGQMSIFCGPGGVGGAAGAAVIGNSNITWNGFGIRTGAIS